MGDDVKGWRRKIGVMMLMTACIFMGGWTRSNFYADFLHISRYMFFSLRGGIYCFYCNEANPMTGVFYYSDSASPLSTTDPLRHSDFRGRWHFQCFGLGYGVLLKDDGQENGEFYRVPYSSITVSLTLISFWLLLSQSRQSISTNPNQAIANEGT